MIRLQAHRLVIWCVALLMVLGLTSCQGGWATPPRDVVAQAIAVQAQDKQTSLWQQLSLQGEGLPSLSVSQVKVRQTRPVKVFSDLAYEVTGTYQYKIRYPNDRQIQASQVPFTVVLQAIPDTEDWQLLKMTDSGRQDFRWSWEPLEGDRA